MNEKLNNIYEEYAQKLDDFADNHAGKLLPTTREEFRNFLVTEYKKELDEVLQYELFLTKSKNTLYSRLMKAQKKLANEKKAEFWYKKLFRKFANRAILEDLIEQAMLYLHIDTYTLLPSEEECCEEPIETECEQQDAVSEEEQEEQSDEATEPTETQETSENAHQQEEQPQEEVADAIVSQSVEAATSAENDEETDIAENEEKSEELTQKSSKKDYWEGRRKRSAKRASQAKDADVADNSEMQGTSLRSEERTSND